MPVLCPLLQYNGMGDVCSLNKNGDSVVALVFFTRCSFIGQLGLLF